ncbi:hypothetical protein M885DRAFT_505721 [Pelagophyceae sp. CCMP2097]|nr:hypothetical protein M885DRAFT_505721 [Pelagophyceae sp. CCMP2097]
MFFGETSLMATTKPRYSLVACPTCGTPTEPRDDSVQCLTCTMADHDWRKPLADHVRDHPKVLAVQICPKCLLVRTSDHTSKKATWEPLPRESDALLGFLLRRIRSVLLGKRALATVEGLSRALAGGALTLADARFVWTEPHSRRLKVDVDIAHGCASLPSVRQRCTLEFVEENVTCDACLGAKKESRGRKMGGDAGTFGARVVIRVKRLDKGRGGARTLRSLEDALKGLRSFTDSSTGGRRHDAGFDVDFEVEQEASRFIAELKRIGRAPLRVAGDYTKKLITHDANSNISDFQKVKFVEVPPIDKFDVVLLDAPREGKKGKKPRLALVLSVRATMRLLVLRDKSELEFGAEQYFRDPFEAIVSADAMVEFVVAKANLDGTVDVQRQGALLPGTEGHEDDAAAEGVSAAHLPPACLRQGALIRGYDLRSVSHTFDGDGEILAHSVHSIVLVQPGGGKGDVSESKSHASTVMSKAALRRQKRRGADSVATDATAKDFDEDDYQALLDQQDEKLPTLHEDDDAQIDFGRIAIDPDSDRDDVL